jgi:hypothetical protein
VTAHAERLRTLLRGDRAALAVCGLFVAALLPVLASLYPNFDEGVYIQQALRVRDGMLPYRDFFCHQTPLHLFTLAAVAWIAPDSLLAYRLPSLLACAALGFVTWRIALARVSRPWALAACVLALAAAVQFHGTVALPNALMAALAAAAVWLAWLRGGPCAAAIAGVLLAVSVLYKPLSVAAAAALALAMLFDRERRRDLLALVAAGGVTGIAAGALFERLSDGAFHELLALQRARYAARGGFEVMQALPTFRAMTREMGVESALAWNLDVHVRALWERGVWNAGLLALAGAAGAVWLAVTQDARARRYAALILLWWVLSAAACVWLWEPIWDHYLIQYAAPMAVGAAYLLERAAARAWGRPLAVLFVAGLVAAAALHVSMRRTLAPVPRYPSMGREQWLTFDPLVNFRYQTRPACGLIDPFNVYGSASLLGQAQAGGTASRFHVSTERLIACLEWDSRIKIGLGYWATFFVDDALKAYLASLPAERFLPGSLFAPEADTAERLPPP